MPHRFRRARAPRDPSRRSNKEDNAVLSIIGVRDLARDRSPPPSRTSRSLAPLAPLAASLVELHASSQQLPEGQPLDLSPETLASMERLRVLAVANNNLTSTAPLAGLRTLEKVDLSKNGLEALSAVAPLLAASPILELDLRGNPITDSRQALDAVIVAGRGIAVLNGRELTAAERPYLEQLHRRGARSLEMLT